MEPTEIENNVIEFYKSDLVCRQLPGRNSLFVFRDNTWQSIQTTDFNSCIVIPVSLCLQYLWQLKEQ